LRVWQKHWNFPMPNLEVEQNHITELKNIWSSNSKLNFQILKSMELNHIILYWMFYCLLLQQNSDATVSFRHERNCGSRGSACQSGSIKPSHVLAEMLSDDDLKAKFTHFSHFNTKRILMCWLRLWKAFK
jgi:cysteine desulfurase